MAQDSGTGLLEIAKRVGGTPYEAPKPPTLMEIATRSGGTASKEQDRTPLLEIAKRVGGTVKPTETTPLSAADEQRFQTWATSNKIADVDHPDSFYDYRGFWKEHPDQKVQFGVDHFPDTYKQHGHPTFSVESKYSSGPDDGGSWNGDAFVPANTKSLIAIAKRVGGTTPPKPVQRPRGPQAAVADLGELPIQPTRQEDRIPGFATMGDFGLRSYLKKEGPITIDTPVAGGALQVMRGARVAARNMTERVPDAEMMNATSDMFEGVARLGSPLLVAAAVLDLPGTVITLGLATLAGKTAQKGAEVAGGDEATQRLAANVAGTVAAMGLGAEQVKNLSLAAAEAGSKPVRVATLWARLKTRSVEPVKQYGPGTVPGRNTPISRSANPAAETGETLGQTLEFAPGVQEVKQASREIVGAQPEIQQPPAQASVRPIEPVDATVSSGGKAPADVVVPAVPVRSIRQIQNQYRIGFTQAKRIFDGLEEAPAEPTKAPGDTVTGLADRVFDKLTGAGTPGKPTAQAIEDDLNERRDHERAMRAQITEVESDESLSDENKAKIAGNLRASLAEFTGKPEDAEPSPSKAVATTPKLALQIGGRKQVIGVKDLEEAASLVDQLREKASEQGPGSGASVFPRTDVIDTNTGKVVAHISYNGRIWATDGLGQTELQARTDNRGYGKPATIDVEKKATEVTVWRGQQLGETGGKWWSSDKAQAAAFANAARGTRTVKPEVLEQKISLEKVLDTGLNARGYTTLNGLAEKAGIDPAVMAAALKASGDPLGAELEPDVETRVHVLLEQPAVQRLLREAGFDVIGAVEDGKATYMQLSAPKKAATPQVQAMAGMTPLGVKKPTAYKATLYRGQGASLEDVYGPESVSAGRAVPILGTAGYYAHSEDDAKAYGDVTEHEVELANPLKITTGAQWRDLLVAADAMELHSTDARWKKNPTDIPTATAKVQAYIKAQGYDGVIISNTETEKRLRESFGHDQVVKFSDTAAPVPADQPVGGAKVAYDKDRHSINIRFAKKPDETVRNALKGAGFRWAKSSGAWYRKLDAWEKTETDLALKETRDLIAGVKSSPAAAPVQQEAPKTTDPVTFEVRSITGEKKADITLPGVPAKAHNVEESKADVQPERTDTGRPADVRGAAQDDRGTSGRGALATVPPADGEGARADGRTDGGRSGGEVRSASDRLPRPTGEDQRDVSLGGGGDVSVSVDVAPSGDTHDVGVPQRDYGLTPERIAAIIGRGSVARVRDNLAAIKLVKQLTAEERYATADEQDVLSKYVGWGASDLAAFLGERPNYNWSKNEQAIYKDLHETVSGDDLKAMKRSTTNAHFTFDLYAPIWQALEDAGFAGGKVLEPAVGVGHAFGFMDPKVRAASTLSASELDPITAAIAHHLYPSARVQPVGFEKIRLPRNSQDIVISNFPFGDFGVRDDSMPGYITESIHNYFFAKSLEYVRPGGLVVGVTSRYTLDGAEATPVRRYLMERADFLGAVRLPSQAFDKSAKTEVVTDLIILRKLLDDEKPDPTRSGQFIETKKSEELSSTQTSGYGRREKTREVNIYRSTWYDAHPDLVLGVESNEGTMYASGQYTVTAKRDDIPASIAEALAKVLKPGDYIRAARANQGTKERKVAEGAYKVGEFRVGPKGTIVRVGKNGETDDVTPKSAAVAARLRGMVGIRDALRATVTTMRDKASTAEQVAKAQQALKKAYDAFVKTTDSHLNDVVNRRLFVDDPEATNIQALEIVRSRAVEEIRKGKTVLKIANEVVGLADIFTKRVIGAEVEIEKVDTPEEALLASLGVHGRMDWGWMQQISGLSGEALQKSLEGKGLVYEHTDGSIALAEEYLSGDVVSKIEDIEASGQQKKYAESLAALKSVQPKPKTKEDVQAGVVAIRLGSHWVPPKDLGSFVREQLGAGKVGYRLEGGTALVRWAVDSSPDADAASSRHALAVRYNGNVAVYGLLDLVDDSLNLRKPVLGHWEGTGKDRYFVHEPEAELAASANQETLRDLWVQYLYEHEDALGRLLDIFNTRFNRTVERAFDGSHLTFPGMATLFGEDGSVQTFYPHQNNAIWRALATGNTLFAHEVGAGKTFAMIALAMKMRQTGRARKVMITVPTYLLRQWGRDVLRLYPTAKVLALDESDLDSAKRQRAMARISQGDWDLVIVPHSSFELLPASEESVIKVLETWVDEMIAAEKLSTSDENVKAMEKARRRIEDKIDKQREKLTSKKDKALTWEDLGVDALMVDEAQAFKNLFFHTKLENLRGLSRSTADKSLDMFVKIDQLNKATNYRNVVFATATPVMNSISEIFSMQRYLQPQTLRRHGLESFDNWYAMFGKAVPTTEAMPDGSYKEVMRLRKFDNLQLLSKLMREVMDYVGWEDMPYLKLPKFEGGKIHTVQTEPHELYPQIREWFAQRLAALKADPPWYDHRNKEYHAPERLDPLTGQPMGRKDNILAVMTDAKKAAIDMRLILGNRAKDWPGSRLNVAADEMVAKWKAEKAKKGVILMFLDAGTPGDKDLRALDFLGKDVSVEETEEAADFDRDGEPVEDTQESDAANLYDLLREALIKRGVPAREIAYVHQARKSAERLALFQAANEGRVRIVFASTDKGGVGMNIQSRLAAMFELDPPRYMRPGDLRQRMGRIIRQGNSYWLSPDGVLLKRYVTKGTTDMWSWNVISMKDQQFRSFYRGDLSTLDDIDPNTMSLEEAQMLAANDKRVIELAELRGKSARMEAQAGAAERALQAAVADVKSGKEREKHLTRDLADLETWVKDLFQSKRGESFSLKVGKVTYDKRADAEAALLEALKPIADFGNTAGTHVATIGDRPVMARFAGFRRVLDADDRSSWVKKHEGTTLADAPKVLEVKRVDLSLTADDIGGDDIGLSRIDQNDAADASTLGKGQDVIAGIVNAYEKVPKFVESLQEGIRQAQARQEQGQRVLDHPPAVIADARAARARIEAIEAELKAESAADAAARAPKKDDAKKEEDGTTLQSTILPGAAEATALAIKGAKAVNEALAQDRGLFRKGLQPENVSVSSRLGAGIMRAHIAAKDQKVERVRRLFEDAKQMMDGWSPAQSLTFMDVMEGVQDATVLEDDVQKVAVAMRESLTYWRDQVRKRGLIKHYIEQYWPHEWKRPGSIEGDLIRRVLGKRPLAGPESFRRRRSIPTTRDGVEIYGLEPVSWNPAEQLLRKVNEMARSVMAFDIRKDLGAQKLRVFIAMGKRAPEGWVRDKDRGAVYGPRDVSVHPKAIDEQGDEVYAEGTVTGRPAFGRLVVGEYWMQPDVARLMVNFLSRGLYGRSVLFDGFRNLSNAHTQVILGWSSFHLWMIGLESIISKQALAAEVASRGEFGEAARLQKEVGPQGLLKDLVRGREAIKTFYADDADAHEVMTMIGQIVNAGGGFGWSLLEHGNAPEKFMADLRAIKGAAGRREPGRALAKTADAGAHGAWALIELPTNAIMNHWVPYLKVSAFLDRAQAELRRLGPKATLEQKREALYASWKAVDDRFGQLRYDNLFWNNTFKQVLTASFLSVGWNLGSIRHGLGVAGQVGVVARRLSRGGGGPGPGPGKWPNGQRTEDQKLADLRGPEPLLQQNMAWLITGAVIIAFAGAIKQYLTADKKPGEGSDEWSQWFRDLFTPRNGQVDDNGREERDMAISYAKDYYAWTQHPLTTVGHKLKPSITLLWEEVNNKDFFKDPIRNEDDPALEQTWQALVYALEQLQPIAWENAKRRLGAGAPAQELLFEWAKIQTLPFTPANAEMERSAAEQYLFEHAAQTGGRTYSQAERSDVRRKLRSAVRANDTSAQQAIITERKLTPRMVMETRRTARLTSLQRSFQQASLEQAIQAYILATPEERALLKPAFGQKRANLLGAVTPREKQTAVASAFARALALPTEAPKP